VAGGRAVVPGALALVRGTSGEFVPHIGTNSPFVPLAPVGRAAREGSRMRHDRRRPSFPSVMLETPRDAAGAARHDRGATAYSVLSFTRPLTASTPCWTSS
jgi:hypothetical protein